MTQSYLQAVLDVTSEIMEVELTELSPETTMEDLAGDTEEIYSDILETAAERLGIGFVEIYLTAPEQYSHDVMASLQALAPFSARAEQVFARRNVTYQIDTLGSIARSLDAGRYVPSGHEVSAPYAPLGKWSAVFKILAWPVGVLAAIYLFISFGPVCQATCRSCAEPSVWKGPIYAGGLALFFVAIRLGPALWAIRADAQEHKKQTIAT